MKNTNVVCAKCHRPTGEVKIKIGRFTYGKCCKQEINDAENNTSTTDNSGGNRTANA